MFPVAANEKIFTFFPSWQFQSQAAIHCFVFTVAAVTTDMNSFSKKFHKQMEMKIRCKWYKIQDFHCQNWSIFFILFAKLKYTFFSSSNIDLLFLYVNCFLNEIITRSKKGDSTKMLSLKSLDEDIILKNEKYRKNFL